MISSTLKEYIEQQIIPLYQYFDTAHRQDHAYKVIHNSMDLAQYYEVNHAMLYTAAAFHDTGLAEGRDLHHLVSGRIVRTDPQLSRWFTSLQIETIAQAAEDHRASLRYHPRSIYGCIVAEADRDIEPIIILRRTIQYGLSHYPQLSFEQQYQRYCNHLKEKYAEGGYIQLFVPQSPNAHQLQLLRDIIADPAQRRSHFEAIIQELKATDKEE